jgi:hypothetical protein
MSDKEPKSLSGLITDSQSGLGRLAREAAARVALSERLRDALEPELAEHLSACNLREDGTLVLLAGNIIRKLPGFAYVFRRLTNLT